MKFEVSENKLSLSSNNPELGDAREEIDVDFSGETISIGFNARYLIDALGSMHAKEVFVGIRDELQPAQIVGADDPDSFAVIMPMRI